MNSYIESQRMSLKQFFSAPNLSIMKVQGQKIILESLCWWIVPYYQDSIPFSRSVLSESLQSYGLQHARLPCPSPTPSSVSCCSVTSNSLQPHGLQNTRPPCPSPTPEVYSNSYPLSQWCHQIISSPVVPFSRLQSFPASGSFPRSQFFTSGGQSIGVSASASVLPMNIQFWVPLGWTGWICCSPKDGLSRVFSNTTVQKHQFFSAQLSL